MKINALDASKITPTNLSYNKFLTTYITYILDHRGINSVNNQNHAK